MQLEKAKLKPIKEEGLGPEYEIKFMFNPTMIQFKKQVNWGKPKPATDNYLLPKSNFSGVTPYTLTINGILFDTYETGESVWKKYIEKLHKATLPPEKKGEKVSKDKRPPTYIFQWGKDLSKENPSYFRCVVTNLTFKYEMFLPNGTPVRATVTLVLNEVDKAVDLQLGAQVDRTTGGRSARESRLTDEEK